MAVSKAIIPTLRDDVAKAFITDMSKATLKPYSNKEKRSAILNLEKIIKEREQSK